MNLLDRYLLAALLRGGAPVFLLFLGLFGFVTLAEQLEDVGKGGFGTLDALRVTGFSLPAIALDLLPVTCLLGTVLGLGTLGNKSELSAMRAAGVSILRLIRPLLALLLGLVIAALLTQQAIIPTFAAQAADLRSQSQAHTTREGDAYWTRSETSLVRVGAVALGLMPTDIEIYQLDAQGRVERLVQAKRADILDQNEWLLQEVRTLDFGVDDGGRGTAAQMRWRSDLEAQQIVALLRAEHALAPTELIGYIAHLQSNGLDAHRHQVRLWQLLSLPVGLLAMGLLGAPFIFGPAHRASMGARVMLCALIGLLFHLGEQVSLQVGMLYRWWPPAIGLAPELVTLTAALMLLMRRKLAP